MTARRNSSTYDEGVGTGRLEHWTGGMFGAGLVANVREAFRFLIFNYDPGDEIFVFGFSRGAYSARTFIGLLRHVGPVSRLHAAKIDDALDLYRGRLESKTGNSDELRQFRAEFSSGVCIGDEDHQWRLRKSPEYAATPAPCLTVRYLGAWDTVGALGVPADLPLASRINRKHAFHDIELDGFVENARHAVALDERRRLFPYLSLGDLTALNRAKGWEPDRPDAPYQERWFPGTHGSVGGGGDLTGLSDGALAWVLKGATKAGLGVDTARGTRLYTFRPNALAPLRNTTLAGRDPPRLLARDRDGPNHLWQLSASAIRRWQSTPDRLPEGKAYRPRSLAKLREQLGALPRYQYEEPNEVIATETVKAGDSLSRYAKRHYGDAELFPAIFIANLDQLLDADDIYPGQKIRIPRIATANGGQVRIGGDRTFA